MNRTKTSAKPRKPIQYPDATANASNRVNKISDIHSEYSVPSVTESTPLPYAQNKTYRSLGTKTKIKPALSASSFSHDVAGIPCPEAVHQFALTHALLPHLERALQLVHECFPTVKAIKLVYEFDWEFAGESWIAINIQAPGQADHLLEEYLQFNRRMVQELPADKGAKILLGFGA